MNDKKTDGLLLLQAFAKIRELEAAGATWNVTNNDGLAPLHECAQRLLLCLLSPGCGRVVLSVGFRACA